jgi:hypothetical protein
LKNFDEFSRVIDFTSLQAITLIDSAHIKDINSLGNVRKLSVSSCPQFQDVSGLGKIPDLSLSHCNEIRDNSALRNNEILTIEDCDNIDVSTANFENVQNLKTDLRMTFQATTTLKKAQCLQLLALNIPFMHLATTVTSVELYFWDCHYSDPVESFSFENFSHLTSACLHYLPPEIELSPLHRVPKVHILDSEKLKSVNGLGMNEMVILENCHKLVDLSALRTIPRLIISNCSFVSCEHINQVRYLKLSAMDNLDFRLFRKNRGGNIQRLELSRVVVGCKRLRVEGLEDIPFLKITQSDLQSLTGLLKNNRTIILEQKKMYLLDPSYKEQYSVKKVPRDLIMLRKKD